MNIAEIKNSKRFREGKRPLVVLCVNKDNKIISCSELKEVGEVEYQQLLEEAQENRLFDKNIEKVENDLIEIINKQVKTNSIFVKVQSALSLYTLDYLNGEIEDDNEPLIKPYVLGIMSAKIDYDTETRSPSLLFNEYLIKAGL